MSNTQKAIENIENFDESSGNLFERILFNNRKIVVSLCLLLTLFLDYQMSL